VATTQLLGKRQDSLAQRGPGARHPNSLCRTQAEGGSEREKKRGWLAKISTHLDHLLGLPGFVFALESRLQDCPEALRAFEQGCAKPGYAAARQAGDR
jgi:hypothetical protein